MCRTIISEHDVRRRRKHFVNVEVGAEFSEQFEDELHPLRKRRLCWRPLRIGQSMSSNHHLAVATRTSILRTACPPTIATPVPLATLWKWDTWRIDSNSDSIQ